MELILFLEKMILKKCFRQQAIFYNINDIEGLDVDNPIDFEIAEYLYKKNFKVIIIVIKAN